MVTWCRLSGDSDQKSHIAVGDRMLVLGCRFWVWMKSGNFSASRTKKTGVLLPVAFLGIEAQREAADVALGIGGAALARHRRKADESFGLFALLQHLGLGVVRDVLGDGQR